MMDHFPFIVAAYALVIVGTGGMLLVSYRGMRRAERRAEELRRDR